MPSGAKDFVEHHFFPEATHPPLSHLQGAMTLSHVSHWTGPLGMISPGMIGGQRVLERFQQRAVFLAKGILLLATGVL